jgi:methyl-accepting chemotaxis protein
MKLTSSVRSSAARLRVGQQLYSAFACVLMLTAAIGGVCFFSMSQTHNTAQALEGKWLQGVGQLSSARMAVLEVRQFEVKHSRTADSSYYSEYEEKMAQATKGIEASLAAYDALVVSDAERALFGTFKKNWGAYAQAQQRVVASGRDKKHTEAIDISDGLASTAIDDATSSLDQLTKYNFDNSAAAAAQAEALYARTKLAMMALLGTTLLVGMGLATLITRHLLRQLGGELQTASDVARAAAAGDLSTSIVLKAGDTQSLMALLKTMQLSLAGVVAGVLSNANSVAATSQQIASGNNDLSQRTEHQASALQETAASMEQLGSTVRQNADNARQANQLAMGASTVAIKGGEVVSQVVTTMKGINDSSKKIADIISVIDGIAFQTNILALNAAVEAARAGEQGRGFAVVASEVRSLAQRSAEAAKEIKGLIGASVERVEQGTTLVDQAGVTMTEIVTAIKRVTDIMGEISAASTEQSAGVAQVGEAISQMDKATQQNAALVEESAAAAEGLKAQAQQMVQAVAVFKLNSHAAVSPASADTSAQAQSKLKQMKFDAPVLHREVAPAMAERRGPDRAKNVTRPDFEAHNPSPVSSPVAKTGTDDWESF